MKGGAVVTCRRRRYPSASGQSRRSAFSFQFSSPGSSENRGHPAKVHMQLSELKTLHVSQLLEMAVTNEIDNANRLRKQELIFALLKNRAKKGESVFGDGTLAVLPDGFGFLRSP